MRLKNLEVRGSSICDTKFNAYVMSTTFYAYFQVLYERPVTKCKVVKLVGNDVKATVSFYDAYKKGGFEVTAETFISILPSIKKALKNIREHQPMKEDVGFFLLVRVHQFNENWVLDVRQTDDNGKLTSDGICFAEKSVTELEAAIDELSTMLDERILSIICGLELSEQIVLYTLYILVEKKVHLLAMSECKGCQHCGTAMHTTCQLPPWSKMTKYANEAINMIDLEFAHAAVVHVHTNQNYLFDNAMLKSIEKTYAKSGLLEKLVKLPTPPSGECFNIVTSGVHDL